MEFFHGTIREECLNAAWFTSSTKAQQIVETSPAEYDESRHRNACGMKTPNKFAKEVAANNDCLGLYSRDQLLQKWIADQRWFKVSTNVIEVYNLPLLVVSVALSLWLL